MKTFVLIEEGKVANTVVADSKEIAEEVSGLVAVEFNPENPAHIGLGFDEDWFEQPPFVEPPVFEDVATGTE